MKKQSSFDTSDNLYKKIINASYDCFCVTDSTGHYILANQATLDSMHLTEDQVLGKTPYDLMLDNVYKNSTILEAIKTKKPVTDLVNVRGVQRLSTSVPYFDQDGNLEYVITNNRSDIVMDEFARLLAYEQEQHAHYKNITNYLCSSYGNKNDLHQSADARSPLGVLHHCLHQQSCHVIWRIWCGKGAGFKIYPLGKPSKQPALYSCQLFRNSSGTV